MVRLRLTEIYIPILIYIFENKLYWTYECANLFPLNFFTSVTMNLDSENDLCSFRLFHIIKYIHPEPLRANMMPVTQRVIQPADLTFLLLRSQEKTRQIYCPGWAEKVWVLWGDCQPSALSDPNEKFFLSLSWVLEECSGLKLLLGESLQDQTESDLQSKSLQHCYMNARRWLAQT